MSGTAAARTMPPAPLVASVIGVAAAVVAAGHRRRSRTRPQWRSVTVLAEPGSLRLEPLDALPPHRLRLERAPGDRGTEVHVRLQRRRGPQDDFAVRTALRDAKSLTETGGILHMDPRPSGRRRPTPAGLLQDEAERVAKGWGLL